MTKDTSGPSSAVGSAHSPSPREHGDDAAGPGQQRPSPAAAGTPQPASSTMESKQPMDAGPKDVRSAESQLQSATASGSTSTVGTPKDATAGAFGPAIPYGTRSRNRTGAARPNYAEDKELDTEFDFTSTPKEASGRKPAKATDAGTTATNPRKNAVPEPDLTTAVLNHYKDPIPGTSTFSANPTVSGGPHHSKKRKATHEKGSHHPSPAPHISTTNTSSRKASTAGIAEQPTSSLSDSNMLSFEGCGAHLKDGKLEADDGTVLQVNGKQPQNPKQYVTFSDSLKLTGPRSRVSCL